MPSSESTVFASGDPAAPPDLRFLHFNDVYHVDQCSAEPVGGLARFQTLCNFYRDDARFHGQPKPLTFFSGDAFNPSLESSVTKGAQPHGRRRTLICIQAATWSQCSMGSGPMWPVLGWASVACARTIR